MSSSETSTPGNCVTLIAVVIIFWACVGCIAVAILGGCFQ